MRRKDLDKVPNGGVYSTVGDLCRFIGGMTGAIPFLKPRTRAEVLQVQTPESKTQGYGRGSTNLGRVTRTLLLELVAAVPRRQLR